MFIMTTSGTDRSLSTLAKLIQKILLNLFQEHFYLWGLIHKAGAIMLWYFEAWLRKNGNKKAFSWIRAMEQNTNWSFYVLGVKLNEEEDNLSKSKYYVQRKKLIRMSGKVRIYRALSSVWGHLKLISAFTTFLHLTSFKGLWGAG